MYNRGTPDQDISFALLQVLEVLIVIILAFEQVFLARIFRPWWVPKHMRCGGRKSGRRCLDTHDCVGEEVIPGVYISMIMGPPSGISLMHYICGVSRNRSSSRTPHRLSTVSRLQNLVSLTTTDAVPESSRIRITNVLWDDAHGAGKSGVPIAAGQHRAATRSSFNRFGMPYAGFANAENICYFRI
ncbi:hypothetical protein HETIRDRAFT_106339 [Heterobasidion irregulare TC 32-1]|uniref:Uncharacterized protein n=1 Tax=Heterobasidion irregulare (strain TC 32-1) TaxID=747525 RepID=W4JQ15_HETIT|nr:uncharacterized protein HETIRDRAFT_106339 [Heterobasidion irregulare TC 32-1]ETW75657.1 hypothetical protein HETIRDRAFT_106339 [Heterobasidion irregulare TC 32-1]